LLASVEIGLVTDSGIPFNPLVFGSVSISVEGCKDSRQAAAVYGVERLR